jgi:signal transduction histidine kinase
VSDLRRATLRFGVAAGAVLLAVLEVQNLMTAALATGRVRARHIRLVERSFAAIRPGLAAALQEDGPAAPDRALRLAIQSFAGAEAELFDLQGRRLAASPRPSPVLEPWPDARRLTGGDLSITGPLAGPPSRLHVYALLGAPGGPLVLRLALPAVELVEELAEWRAQLLTHVVAILALALAGGLALFPVRAPGDPGERGLDAYGEAIARLRQRGEALASQHEEERHRAEQRWREAGSLVRAGELTAGMAHELRNGLATILGYARLAERTESLDEARQLAGQVRAESDTLAGVVRRFVELVRDDRLALSTIDVSELLARVAAREAGRCPGITVEHVSPAGLRLVADEGLLERALENLLRNALEAAASRVRLEAREEDPWTVLVVEDDGPGMPAEARLRPRPFASGRPGGLGLGLPLVAKLAGLHGGELRLDEAQPHGLRASLRLPSRAR